MTRITAALLAALAAVAMAAGCRPGRDDAPGDAGAAAATFVAEDIRYREAPDRVAAGEVTVELVNEGQIDHNVVIEELGDTPVAQAAPGETATGTVTLDRGEYVVYCSIPGHREAGMEATLSVE